MERMVNTREEVEATPNELEVFREAREVRLLVEHEAREDLDEDLAGTDVELQGVEKTTSAQVRLGQPSGTHKILTQEGVDTGEQTEPMFHPDGVSHPVVQIWAQSDFCQASRPPGWEWGGGKQRNQETESVSEKLIRGGKGTPHELDTLPLSSDPAITKPDGKPTRDLVRWTHRTQQSPIRAARVRVGDKDRLLISHNIVGYPGWR